MKLPPDLEFYEDIRLLIYRPCGLINRAAVNRIITVLGELEITLKEPFNRFSDTVAADAVDLNFKYPLSTYWRKNARILTNQTHMDGFPGRLGEWDFRPIFNRRVIPEINFRDEFS
jgi:hypothetical protein